MTPELGITRYFLCPRCGKHRFTYSHLEPGRSFGPWGCDTVGCNADIRGKITLEGEPDITVVDRDYPKGLMLIKFRDLYLVVEGYRFYEGEEADHYDFLVHSHQCPSNLLRATREVFEVEQGSDPHGVLRFVAAIEDTPNNRETLHEEVSLTRLFQVFQTDGVPPPTNWPERNCGMLPGLADFQREHAKRYMPKA